MKSGIGARIWGWLCALVALAVAAVLMRMHGFGFGQQLRLGAATALQIVLPGLGLTAWMRRPTIIAWLGAAFVLGLPVQLIGWALGVTTGIVALMWAIPIVVGLACLWLTRGRLRANWRRRTPLGWWQAIVLLLVWVGTVIRVSAHWVSHPNGDKATAWYQDLYWHLGINASAVERVPMQDPQAIGENLTYHWLTNGHIGGLVRSTGVNLLSMTAHAWLFPVMAATIAVIFGLAHHIARRTEAGTLAAVFWFAAPSFAVNLAVRDGGFGNFQLLSPSHMLAMPVTVMVIWLFVVVLKSGAARRHAAWLPLVLTLLLVSGVKVSALPALACGVIAAGFSTLLLRRRRRTAFLLLTLVVGTLVVTFPLFGGGGGGSEMGIMPRQQQLPKWLNSVEASPGLGLEHTPLWFAAFVGLLLANALWLLPGVFAMRWRDPVGWLLAGSISSAIGVTYVLRHPGGSEAYFPMGFQPVMAVAAAVGIVSLVRRLEAHWRWVALAVAAVSLAFGVALIDQPVWDVVTTRRLAFGAAIVAGAVLLAIVAIAVLGWRRGAALAGVAFAAFGTANGHTVLSSVLESAPEQNRAAIQQAQAAVKPERTHVNPDEMAALRHVAELPPEAVVATNVHCYYVESTPFCNNRGFWVAGLGQHRVLLGGWGYTNLGRSTEGQNGQSHNNNPYPDQELYELNERAFQTPDAETFEQLKELGATHLFADRRASDVVPADEWCEPTFENATVTVCEIR